MSSVAAERHGWERPVRALLAAAVVLLCASCGERTAPPVRTVARATGEPGASASREEAPTPAAEPGGSEPSPGTADGPAPDGEPAASAAPLASHASWGGVEVELVGRGRLGVILLHGFGAPPRDLLPIGRLLAGALPVRVAVPTSPRIWPGGGDGRMWFARVAPESQVARAVAEIEAIREGLVAEGRAPEDIVVAGFSQGASLTLELAMSMRPPPRAAIVFSARELPRLAGRWGALDGMPVFVSHGRSDPLIPFHDGEGIDALAREAGAEVTFVPFDGRHEMPDEVLAAAIEFLRPLTAE